MAKLSQMLDRAASLLKQGAVIITAATLEKGVAERIQVYFLDGKEAVMDVITKDDLVQNFPDEGVYVLAPSAEGAAASFPRVEMFEGAEDMYFRIDGTKTEADDFGPLPSVLFMETVEAVSTYSTR